MAQPTIAQDAQQITTNGGVAYSTSDTQIKYRTINQGSPLSHDNVDANFEIFRKAINGLVADITAINVDIDGVVDKDISSVMSGVTLSYSSSGRNYGIRKSGTNLYVNVPWTDTTYSAGNGINLSGTQFTVSAGGGLSQTTSGVAHADTSSQSSVNNSGRTYIQDISLDTYGHVIGINSATESYTYSLPTASSSTLGGIKVGSRLSISNGVLSADNQSFSLPTASSTTLGGVKVGSGLSISSGVLSANVQSLPTASSSTLGGVKVGDGLSISNGVLSADVSSSGGTSSNINFALGRPVYAAFNLSAGPTAIANLLELYQPTGSTEGGQIHYKFGGQTTPDGIEQHAYVTDTLNIGTNHAYRGISDNERIWRVFSTYPHTSGQALGYKTSKVQGGYFFTSGDYDGRAVLSIPGQLYHRLYGFSYRSNVGNTSTYQPATFYQNLLQDIQQWPDGTDNTDGLYTATGGQPSKTIPVGIGQVTYTAAPVLPQQKYQVLAYHPTIPGFGGSRAADQHYVTSGFSRYSGGATLGENPNSPNYDATASSRDPKLEVTIAKYERIVGAWPPFFYNMGLKMRMDEYPDTEPDGVTNFYYWRDSIYPDGYKVTLGTPTYRFLTLFTHRAVDTSSDRNLKGEIKELEEAERRVAVKAKSLIRRYRLKEEKDGRIIYILSDAQIQELTGDSSMKGGNYYFFQKPDEAVTAANMVLSEGKWDISGEPIALADFYREETVEKDGETIKKLKDVSEVINYLQQEGVQENEEGKVGLGMKKHFGIIAQDLEQAFLDEGLDPNEYGVFKKHIFWEGINKEGKRDRSNKKVDGYKEVIERSVRYDELWALIISTL